MLRKEKYAAHQIKLAEEKQKTKKQKRVFVFGLLLLFVPPLLLFPAIPSTTWEYNLYQVIEQHLYISVGAKGPLPFFTMLSSLYTGIYVLIMSSYWAIQFIRSHGLGRRFQQQYYEIVFDHRSKHADKFPILDQPIFKKTCVSLLFIFCFMIGLFHFINDDISFASSSRRGQIFVLMYNTKLGVIVAEFLFSLIYVIPVFYFLFLFIYLINILRGLGAGQNTPLVVKQRRKKQQSNLDPQ